MISTNYREEFCLALDFDPLFIADLMAAGFLVMSARFSDDDGPQNSPPDRVRFVLLPKLHLMRSALFFPELHETRSARRLLNRYELRFDEDFDPILERCAAIHGDDWLTLPLRERIKAIRTIEGLPVRPVSFGVYRDGERKAGEFGVMAGRVYTSYSGYRDEDSAGTVQLILMARYLRDAGFDFLDLGMPMDYKDRLGARNIDPGQFVELFRNAQQQFTF
jgi:Leu/Phe-tRNA-protein transferase